ncbi:MAG: phage tail protein I [Cetobacterium sp.]|uniref:phage tail protein I n=1 Tax=Cetobacterium sp. TaxID=2071632 RepID=UPI003EE602AB
MNKDEIYSLLPENLKKYRNISGIAYAMSEQVSKDNSSMDSLKIYLNMKNLDDKVLDQLAWQWNVEFYSSELPKLKKIEMINRSYFHHITKGTVGALESALKAIVSNLEVKEWYEYGGNPFMFRLIVEGDMLTEEEISTVYKLVDIYKNVRSHLDGFIITQKNDSLVNFINGIHDHKKVINKFIG